jgi:hypothetical protein
MINLQADLEQLYSAIMDRVKGQQVTAVGHKGRNVAYDSVSLADMVKMYRMLWTRESGLPELPVDLEANVASRGCFNLRLR